MAAKDKPVFQVQVRELVEFALRSGDLGGEREFVGPQRALDGIRGHQKVQRSRPPGYRKEVPLSHDVKGDEFVLRVQGRLDGLLVTPEATLLEEIKTVQGRWDGVADPLHWAQVRLYGFIYAHAQPTERVILQLTYLELDTGQLTEFRECLALGELGAFFAKTTALYLDWVREHYQWCLRRDQTVRSLAFPFPQYRPGQRKLAVAVYRAVTRGARLFLEAPTGIGKTISAVFPAVKTLAEGELERIFYLTARTTGRAVAEKAFADLRRAGAHLRTLTLTAKEKVCLKEGRPCDPQTCPLARGYYDRCKAALRDLLGQEEITRPVLDAASQKHQVCPFELSLDLSPWVDAVICDYNYVFDPKVYLRRHFAEGPRNYAFVIDEAHNLVDRARAMFSADLDCGEIREVGRAVRNVVPRCAQSLRKLNTALRKLGGDDSRRAEPPEVSNPAFELNLFPAESGSTPGSPSKAGQPAPGGTDRDGVCTRRKWPDELGPLLDDALKEAESWLGRNEPAEFREALLELYFRLHTFRRTAELYDERYVTVVWPGASVRVELFCLDPSHLLREALGRGKAAVFLSATLTPADYYRDLLGGSSEDVVVRLRSPFPPEHLAVLVHDRIRTDYRARAGTLVGVAETIGALVEGRRGNYLVYLPSYQYLGAVREQFQSAHPSLRTLAQRPGMSEPERETFLAAFAAEHEETLVGFAVLGGVFGEGIDLVGDRLIGAVIVGVGLPQLCAERDLIRGYFQEKTGAGFDYAYTFPGMNRVLQSIGRVIRSETDRGVVMLVDTRFGEHRYQRLLPDWWQPKRVRSVQEIQDALRSFWP